MLAGLAGSSALNAVTYLDMTIRARPASSTPEETIRRLSEISSIGLGPEDRAANRRSGLGPLLGYTVAVANAVGFAMLAGRHRLPLPVAAGLLGAGAMLASSGSMTVLGVTDPRRWRGIDWLSDIVPHLTYGIVAADVWRRLTR